VAIPDLIPIMHEPGYRTDTIGSYVDGQFFASIVAGFAGGKFPGDDWARHKRWYAVLHRFDHDGHHTGSDIWFAGATADGESAVGAAAEKVLHEWLAQLPGLVYGDIAVRLFQLEVDGIVFGLVDETDDEFGEHVELHPDDLGFSEPWDGEYDT
jgi:hypothetical protein